MKQARAAGQNRPVAGQPPQVVGDRARGRVTVPCGLPCCGFEQQGAKARLDKLNG